MLAPFDYLRRFLIDVFFFVFSVFFCSGIDNVTCGVFTQGLRGCHSPSQSASPLVLAELALHELGLPLGSPSTLRRHFVSPLAFADLAAANCSWGEVRPIFF